VIDAASNGPAPWNDRINTPRPIDGDGDGSFIVDIGAFEFIAGAEDVPIPCDVAGAYTTADGLLEFEWQAGTCTDCPITITYVPVGEPLQPLEELGYAGLSLGLGATDCNGDPCDIAQPITLTVNYTDTLLPPGVDEATLSLYWWDDEAGDWVAMTVIARDPDANTITIQLDHLSQFALFVPVELKVYLPIVVR